MQAAAVVGGRRQNGRMTVTGRLEAFVLDASDIAGLASFYAELAGWQIIRREPDWITTRTSDGQEIAFQLASDHLAPEWPGQARGQQCHLDLQIEDHEAAALRAVALGATRLADGPTWVTLADPAGHPFDLCQKDGVGPAMALFAVTIDAPDASALARFYADLLGAEVTYDGPEGALVAAAGKSVMFQQVAEYGAPQWPDPEHPQQGHLDIVVDDLDAAQTRVLELGASPLNSGDEGFRVFADPAGHPFCLCL
jgi:predicted enzyme related to lactoylglutathione lyase